MSKAARVPVAVVGIGREVGPIIQSVVGVANIRVGNRRVGLGVDQGLVALQLRVGVFAGLEHGENLVLPEFFQIEVVERRDAKGLVVVGVDRSQRRAIYIVATHVGIGFHAAGSVGNVEIRIG